MDGHITSLKHIASSIARSSRALFQLLALSFALAFVPLTQAGEVRQPNGDYVEDHVDLTVKVLGGEVQAGRMWANGCA